MSPKEAVRALEDLATAVGIPVRIEPFDLRASGRGGLCRIQGRRVILVDARLSAVEQAGVIGEALAKVDLRGVAASPAVLAFVGTGHAAVRPLARPRPIAWPAARSHLRLVKRS